MLLINYSLKLFGIIAILLFFTVLAQDAKAATFTVNSTDDNSDSSINGICATSAGKCSLRAAVGEANSNSGADTINFNIPGSGVQTIQLTKTMTFSGFGSVVVNGYSQPGSLANTDPLISNAKIMIQLEGTGPSGIDGLFLHSPNNTLKGLAFFNFRNSLAIEGSSGNDNKILGNFLGTDAAGNYRAPSHVPNGHGIHVQTGASRNIIGGTANADRNIISGNPHMGIRVDHSNSKNNVIINNIIGLGPKGDKRMPNIYYGIDINFGPNGTVVGGLNPGERNVVSGNSGAGIEISHDPLGQNNKIIGNFVGISPNGNSATSFTYNGGPGIRLKDSVNKNTVSNNVVGTNKGGGIILTFDPAGNQSTTYNNQITSNWIGISPNGTSMANSLSGISVMSRNNNIASNIISNNPIGISIIDDASDGNIISKNQIYNNTNLGIDLDPNGVTANDIGDGDSGPNQNLNFPEIATATPQAVTGSACANCKIEVFIADVNNGTSNGEGKTFVGGGVATSSGTFNIPVSGVNVNQAVTSTATDSLGNTSEFSTNKLVI